MSQREKVACLENLPKAILDFSLDINEAISQCYSFHLLLSGKIKGQIFIQQLNIYLAPGTLQRLSYLILATVQ